MRKAMQAVCIPAALVFGMAGCSVMDGPQSAGTYTSDSAITAKVKAKLVEEERRAIALAREVEGVKAVRDAIQVQPANK